MGDRKADRYANFKAQAWMHLRRRIERTHLAVTQRLKVDRDEIFSIDPKLPELDDLFAELTQIRYTRNASGKILVEKTPEGFTSPDRADAVLRRSRRSTMPSRSSQNCEGNFHDRRTHRDRARHSRRTR